MVDELREFSRLVKKEQLIKKLKAYFEPKGFKVDFVGEEKIPLLTGYDEYDVYVT